MKKLTIQLIVGLTAVPAFAVSTSDYEGGNAISLSQWGYADPLNNITGIKLLRSFYSTGYRNDLGYDHTGTDFMVSAGTEVKSICDGSIYESQDFSYQKSVRLRNNFDSYYNSRVIVKCNAPTPFLAIYMHVDGGLSSGSSVSKGTTIAKIAPAYTINNVRYYANDHLHFGLNINTSYIAGNPYGWGVAPSGTSRAKIEAAGFRDAYEFLSTHSNSNAANTISAFDGAGSIVRPNENCWGCNKDEAKMHPRKDRTSTVVFQWMYDANTCEHVDISTSPNIGTVSVQARGWSDHLTKTGFASTLPTSVTTQGGTWNIFSVTSTKPLTSDVSVFAYCKNNSDPKVGSKTSFTTPNLVEFDESYFWSGNGSIISLSNQSGYGGTKDDAVTFNGVGHNSLTVFQWYKKSSCPNLQISAPSASSSIGINGVSIKPWNALDFGSNLCTQLPCTISAPADGNYYLVKIKSASAAIPGNMLRASCTN